MRPINTLTNPVVHQCHFDFEMGDVAEWAVCPESWGEHPSQAPAALPLSGHPTRGEDRRRDGRSWHGLQRGSHPSGLAAFLSRLHAATFIRERAAGKDLPLFTGQGLCFVEATVRKQQFMLKEKLNKNDGMY